MNPISAISPANSVISQEMLDKTNPNSPYYTPQPVLSVEAFQERAYDLAQVYRIAQVRESPWPQFDGMGYMKYNETNEMADISFIPPKKNKGDTRITTGITHEKDSALVSFFLNLSFEGTVRIFKDDKELYDLSTTVTKMVRKSREIESYNNKRSQFYRNFIAQGTAFAREQYAEYWIPDKQITGKIDPSKLDQVTWVDKGLKKHLALCETILVDGKKVFMEDIRQPDIQKQPSVYTIEYLPRQLMKSIWMKNENWQYVPWMQTAGGMGLGSLTQGSIYSDWIWGEVDYSKIEVITKYRPFDQTYQIYLNSIPMLKPFFPLQAVSPSGLIPLSKGDTDLMNMFAYSKSEPAKVKVDQRVYDELLQNMVMMSRQAARVPRANNSGKILSPDMFIGGRLVSNIDPNDVPPLIEDPGIKQYDFSFFQLFKQHIDDKTINEILQGQAPAGDVTAVQYMEMQKQAMMKLGSKLDGLINWEEQMLKLRTYNLLTHVEKMAVSSGDEKMMTVSTATAGGSKGSHIVKFKKGIKKSSQDVYDEEKAYKKQTGIESSITYIDPELLAEMVNDPTYYFKFEVIPVDRNNDKLAQAAYVEKIDNAAKLFGMESLQVADLKRRYAEVMGETYDEFFLSPDQLKQQQQQAQQEQQSAMLAGQMKPGQMPTSQNNQQQQLQSQQNQPQPSPFQMKSVMNNKPNQK